MIKKQSAIEALYKLQAGKSASEVAVINECVDAIAAVTPDPEQEKLEELCVKQDAIIQALKLVNDRLLRMGKAIPPFGPAFYRALGTLSGIADVSEDPIASALLSAIEVIDEQLEGQERKAIHHG